MDNYVRSLLRNIPYDSMINQSIKKAFNSKFAELRKMLRINSNIRKGYQILTLEKITQGEIIFQIPLTETFNGIELEEIHSEDKMQFKNHLNKIVSNYFQKDHYFHYALVQHLNILMSIYLNTQNKKAEKHEFAMSFPESFFNLGSLSKENYDKISSDSLKHSIYWYKKDTKDYWNSLTKDNFYQISFEDFNYLYNTIHSRKIKVESDKGEISVISPLVDLINHSTLNNCEVEVKWLQSAETSMLTLYSSKDIYENEELLINYDSNIFISFVI